MGFSRVRLPYRSVDLDFMNCCVRPMGIWTGLGWARIETGGGGL